MPEKLIIKCPNPACGREQSVDYNPRMEKHSATCPCCKKRYKFNEWIKVTPTKPAQLNTPVQPNIPPQSNIPPQLNIPIEPNIPISQRFPLQSGARVVVESTGDVFRLKVGVNVLGRQSPKSKAEIQIPNVSGKKLTSKEHLVIIGDKKDNGMHFSASLYKADANPTFVGDMQLLYGQWLKLNPGDIIYLPDETLRFEI